MPEMKEVKSSNISHVGFDAEDPAIVVRFHTSNTYRYTPATEQEFKDFIDAPSIGKHFQLHIKGNPRYRVDPLGTTDVPAKQEEKAAA